MDTCIVYASKNKHPRNSSRKAIVSVEQIVIPKEAGDRFTTRR